MTAPVMAASARGAAAGPARAADADARFMDLALALGRRGLGQTWPNPSVGCVVVRFDGDTPVIVGRGVTQPGGRPHAEVEALRHAGAAARGATLYATLEPCSHHGKTPPCADAIVAAGVARVVSSMEDPNPEISGRGHARLRAAGIAVEVGPGAAQARRAHAGHLCRIRDGHPHVMLKLGISADGKVGLPGRRPVQITGAAARDRIHMMRAQSDAIMIGIGTALADDPQLTCRLPGMAARSPVRVIVDSALRLPLDSVLVRTARQTPVWVVASADAPEGSDAALRARGVEVFRLDAPGRPDLGRVLRLLAGRGITRLMVEGGPLMAAALVGADLVDEVDLVRAPRPLGEGIDALEGLPLTAITQSPRFAARAIEAIGEDTLESYERV